MGCWVLGSGGASGGVACSRAAHDALGEAARDNDLLALLVHFGAARGQFRGLTFERRHPGSVRLAEGRSFASVHTHSAARERRRHGRRPGRAPPQGQGLDRMEPSPRRAGANTHPVTSEVAGSARPFFGYFQKVHQQQVAWAVARRSPAKITAQSPQGRQKVDVSPRNPSFAPTWR